ncbi:MAG: antitoxin family protein [Labilithrix sp.]|nr:antitoxin family protein [Labilithrix sp.]
MQQPFRARVRNGRLVLDEPTDLPEGEEVELVPADAGDMDDAERAALHESLAISLDQMKKGQLIDGDEVLARLRARR